MFLKQRAGLLLTLAAGCILVGGTCRTVSAADTPGIEQVLAFRPIQADVEYEIPEKPDYPKCQVQVERQGKSSGWVVIGPAGQILRRFIDTNGDGVVDQWRYYQHGLEVYRDMDTDFNKKVDQSRWLNTAGSRWGVDSNEDGKLDQWRILSAEEATREAVRALINRDVRALEMLLVTEQDLNQLTLSSPLKEKLLEAVSNPSEKLRNSVNGANAVTPQSKWIRFDGSMPSIIPADEGKAKADLWVYENAMAITETGNQPGLVQIGELLKVGNVWKLTQLPQPLNGTSQLTVGAPVIMQPELASIDPGIGPGNLTPEMQKLLQELQALDQNHPQPNATRQALADYNKARADILSKLVEASQTNEEREQWLRQMVDGIAAAVQTGTYPEGLRRLQAIEKQLRENPDFKNLHPYISYRLLLASYSEQLQQSKPEDREKIQEWWLGQLAAFVTSYPNATDAPEALLQLANTNEFNGKISEARKWYEQLISQYPETRAGERAKGAMRRLDLQGQPLVLAGAGLKGGKVDIRSYKGRVVLVLFWASWCRPCTEDLPQIKALYQQYQRDGFEIIGVNLDSTTEPIQPYLTQQGVNWAQIYEPGGLESEPARYFGIISLPTMFLVDASGKVVNRNISVEDLKEAVPDLLKK